VLRCAARFYVHIDRADYSLALLQRAQATKHDPWLMAPEISIALVADRPSKMAAIARKELKRGIWSPRNRSELEGSLGTLFLEGGSASQARQMFRNSLDDPTENAIAQAQWAVERTTGLMVPENLLKLPVAYEARALCNRTAGRWDRVIHNCWHWAEYEPTSSRSMLMGSYAASVAFEDGPMIIEFSSLGLEAEPQNPILINNLAVGYAYKGELKEAWKALENLVVEDTPDIAQPALYATMGLLSFRSGDLERGRILYEKAINHFYSQKFPIVKALALWHLVREEAHAETKEFPQVLRRAELATEKMKFPEIDAIRARLPKQH
jgi:tetratricopeptide (TPR) repeat protein